MAAAEEIRELTVDLGDRSYPIYIGSGLHAKSGAYFKRLGLPAGSPLLLVTDASVHGLYADRIKQSLEDAGYQVAVSVVPSGESSKSLAQLDALVADALTGGLDRKSTVVALGGGVVGDLAGFLAAVYMRGVRFVQMPTTILAHDSSVGGKTAVNHSLAKNIIGAFHQPEAVLYDLDALVSLPPREVRSGLSEVIKHGLIWDAAFVDWCEENAERLLAIDPDALGYALYEGCKVKSIVVSRDERENDLRAILNLGHTIGHALEAAAGYGELLHGEAIAIGMVGSARLAARFGYGDDMATRTEAIFRKFGLPVRIPAHLAADEIMKAMQHDKKFSEGSMVFVVPTSIGSVEIRRDVSAAWVREIVEGLTEEA